MCRSCDKDAFITESYWTQTLGLTASHYGAEGDTALGPDGIGDSARPGFGTSLLVVTEDSVPDEIGGNPSLEVGGASIISTIDTLGDRDFFQVTLQAGETYEIGQYAKVGGPSGTPLSDAYIELYDADGNLLTTADGGGPNTPSGLDALLSFTAETSGTYYVNARSFDNVPEDGGNGDVLGDYEVFARIAPEGGYVPYYDVDSPLYSLDWGTQVNRVHETVRNPDGEEGPRPTGNEESAPPENAYDITDKNVITIYFAKEGDVFASEDPANPGLPPVLVSAGTKDWEKEVVFTALGEFEKVADVEYREVATREEADFFFTTYAGTPGPGASLLGSMAPPDYPDEGLAQFNSGDYRWTEQNLQQGGFSYVTLIHEFGHGHGMAHPHDNGGRSGIMNGVEEESTFNYTTGEHDLNQGVHTMMSYEDGWQSSPYGNAPTDVGYGYLGGLMAFDIAVIQDKYGVNEEWATGDNVYQMKDVNAAGTYYESIWDAGGVDAIVYRGNRAATINLNDASLQYEVGGGGLMSYANGVFGGYTIANSVTIENATTFNGNDRIVGNEVDNVLRSGSGDDRVKGGLGNDNVRGEAGTDSVAGDEGDDRLFGQAGLDTISGGSGNDYVYGGDNADVMGGNVGDDLLVGGLGRDVMTGGSGVDTFSFDDGDISGLWNQADQLLDFSRFEGDRINLRLMDADSTSGGDQNFAFIGEGKFTKTAGELRQFDYDGKTLLAGDTNGDGVGDFFINVGNQTQMLTTDFIL